MAAAQPHVLLSAYTTLRLGGPARSFVLAGTEAELVAGVRDADRRGEPVLVLGGGSNLVIGDDGFDGTVIKVAADGLRMTAGEAAVTVTAAAGLDWDALVRRCVADGLAGVECLAGIPGLVGATPIQNVGAYGQEVAETITTVRAYDRARGEVVELPAARCGFGYRTSRFKQSTGWRSPATPPRPPQARVESSSPTGRFVVLSVGFALARDPLTRPIGYAELARTMGVAIGGRVPLADASAAVLGLRRSKGMVLDEADPDSRSAGSFFTNPVVSPAQLGELERAAAARFGPDVAVPRFPADGGAVKVPAAWLIERAGFTKGYPAGAAVGVSAKHTLALINRGGGSTKELLALASEIRDGVRASFGIELVPEPVLAGAAL